MARTLEAKSATPPTPIPQPHPPLQPLQPQVQIPSFHIHSPQGPGGSGGPGGFRTPTAGFAPQQQPLQHQPPRLMTPTPGPAPPSNFAGGFYSPHTPTPNPTQIHAS